MTLWPASDNEQVMRPMVVNRFPTSDLEDGRNSWNQIYRDVAIKFHCSVGVVRGISLGMHIMEHRFVKIRTYSI